MKTNFLVAAAMMLLALSTTSCKKETPASVTENNLSSEPPVSAIAGKPSAGRTTPAFPLEKYSWKVGNLSINGYNSTAVYAQYHFQFNPDHTIFVTREDLETFNGAWSLNNSNNLLSLTFDPLRGRLNNLAGNWKIVRITENNVYLRIDDMAYQAELRFDVDLKTLR